MTMDPATLPSERSHSRARCRPSEISSPASPLRLILLLTVSHASFGGARLAISLQALQLQASPLVVGLLMSLLMLVPTFVAVHVVAGLLGLGAGYAARRHGVQPAVN